MYAGFQIIAKGLRSLHHYIAVIDLKETRLAA
jgi:hypothetical protein